VKFFEWFWRPGPASVAGILGPVAVLIGAFFTALGYTGSAGESYSPANHLVSELGDTNISARWPLFSLSLIVGGLCTLAFMPGLAKARGGKGLARAAGILGFIAGIGGILVGVFPINLGAIHVVVAFVFFVLGWLAITLLTIGFGLDPTEAFPRWLVVPGLISFMLSVLFLLLVITGLPDGLFIPSPRPDQWPPALTEWLALLGMLGWTLLVAIVWLSSLTGRSTARASG
jgi:hypothetical membrane protein